MRERADKMAALWREDGGIPGTGFIISLFQIGEENVVKWFTFNNSVPKERMPEVLHEMEMMYRTQILTAPARLKFGCRVRIKAGFYEGAEGVVWDFRAQPSAGRPAACELHVRMQTPQTGALFLCVDAWLSDRDLEIL